MPSFRQQFSYKINKAELDMAAIGRYDLSEPSRAEPSRAEPSRAEPSRAEPSRAVKLRIVKSSFHSFCIVNYSITKNSYNRKRLMK